MNSFTIFCCLFISASYFFFYSHAVPVKPLLELEKHGDIVLPIRTKKNAIPAYPHRTMMLASFYRPVRHSHGSQAGGVFAQGNAVSGGSYLRSNQPDYLARGPEPDDESEISSAEAEAAPEPQEDSSVDNEDQDGSEYEDESEHQWQKHIKTHPKQTSNKNDELPALPTEAPVGEEPDVPQTSVKRPTKVPGLKKTKKTTVQIEEDDQPANDDDDDDDDDEHDDEPSTPFVPFKPNRRSNSPNLNNFFPMVFSFPKSYSRQASSGAPPGMITAIANSFSTARGGVASSMATAYGGSPNKKKKRNQSTYDE